MSQYEIHPISALARLLASAGPAIGILARRDVLGERDKPDFNAILARLGSATISSILHTRSVTPQPWWESVRMADLTDSVQCGGVHVCLLETPSGNRG
jgi:hypothetical protein